MNPNSPDQINQEVSINFEGEDNLTKIITKVNDNIGKLQLGLLAAKGGVFALNKATKESVESLTKLSAGLGVVDKILNKGFNIASITKVGAILTDGILKARKQLNQFEDGLKAMAASGYSTQILSDFSELANVLTLNTARIEQFSLQALTAYNRFARAKAEVEVLFKPGEDFVVNLSKNIQTLVNGDLRNAITSIDALGASYQAASALFTDAADNQSVMVAGLKLAKAGGAETGVTMQALTQTIRAYNLQASDADKVAVAFNKTIQLGITTLPELAQGFAQTAVVAKEAGLKLEELTGAVAALTLKGSSTPSALTGLEALSRVIINKTPQATAALR
jgi:hypothetical protein